VTPIIKNKKTGRQEALVFQSPFKAGLYCAKYMGKDDKEWNHRVRATRNLGLLRIKELLDNMRIGPLVALTWRPRNQNIAISLRAIHSVPIGLIRSLAKQMVFSRNWASNQLDFKTLMRTTSDAFRMMRSAVRDGDRPSKMPSEQFYDWVGQFLPEDPAYCDRRLKNAHSALQYLFPPDDQRAAIKIAGNDIGI